MPQGGGIADKLGNCYEGRWAINSMIDVLDELSDSMRLEPPGEEGKGVEFWVDKSGKRTYFQVKRQITSKGYWSLSQLNSQEILENFWSKLQDPNVECVFASIDSAFELRELTDRARSAVSWEEFNREFLNVLQHSTNFKKLCGYLKTYDGYSEEKVYERLKRIIVKTVDDGTLRSNLENRIKVLVSGEPQNTVDILAAFALDNLQHEINAIELWNFLEKRGFTRNHWAKDPHILPKIIEINQRYSSSANVGIAGKIIARDAVKTILDKLSPESGISQIMVSGEAGNGKSSILMQVVKELDSKNVLVLAFRIDRLEPTLLPENIGQQLGLPGSPVPVLSIISQKHECVLIIDQLDAVSMASGRNPDFFECIRLMIQQTEVYPNLKLVLSCRNFDIENDYRIKRLINEGNTHVIAIERFTHEQVRTITIEIGINPNKFTEKQLELLSSPLNLRLLAEIHEMNPAQDFNFEKASDLFSHFWEFKQAELRKRLNGNIEWTAIINKLCDYMSNNQVLYAPKIELNDFPPDNLNALVSERVLNLENKKYSFFHESFFDYAFARYMASKKLDLLTILTTNEQHLFRRAQVRQILLQLRESYEEDYLKCLSNLLSNPKIRFHIKQIVFALLAMLTDPTEKEWIILSHILQVDNPKDIITQHIWSVLKRSIYWFRLLDSLGIIKNWLSSNNDILINETITILRSAQDTDADRVAELLDAYLLTSEEWNQRLKFIMTWADLSKGRHLFELFLTCLRAGILDDVTGPIAVNSTFWDLLYSLEKYKPAWCAEAIAEYLYRLLKKAEEVSINNPFEINDEPTYNSTAPDIFMTSATESPKEFVKHILPFVLTTIEKNIDTLENEKPFKDLIWRYKSSRDAHTISYLTLQALERALSVLAKEDPDYISNLNLLWENTRYETILYLLMMTLSANGEYFADTALDLVLSDQSRLKVGNLHGSYWVAINLLKETTPYCTKDKLDQLEEILLDYYPEDELSKENLSRRGVRQFRLLSAITEFRRSSAVIKRIQEWSRKFDATILVEPVGIMVGPVVSPIPDEVIERMSDSQWINAIQAYKHSDRLTFQKNGTVTGGAHQISNQLKNETTNEPIRFSNLLLTLSTDTNPSYFSAILRGLTEASINDMEILTKVCIYCHNLPNRPLGKEISRFISKNADKALSDEVLNIICWYATSDPDPEQEMWRTEASPGNFYYSGDIVTAAINSARGTAAETLGKLLFKDENKLEKLLPAITTTVNDRIIAVRVCAVNALLALLNHDRELAINLFQKLCDTEDVLLNTPYVGQFIFYAGQTHFTLIKPIIIRMLESANDEVKKAGARSVCLLSLAGC